MSQTLKLLNYSAANIVDRTQLTADVAPASGSLTVADANDFTTGYVLVGFPGSKQAELLPNTSVTSGTSITLTSNTVLQHKAYEQVLALYGNKLKIYRAANVDGTQPADSSFTLQATIDIDPNDDFTSWLDSTGGSGYWYKYTYYNSGNLNESDIAKSNAYRFVVDYCSTDEVREEAGFKHALFIPDTKIDQYRYQAQNEIDGALNEFYTVPLVQPIPDYVKRINIRMAAGYLRLSQYSQISDPALNGQDMVDEAQEQLDKLIMKEREVMTKDGKSLAGAGATGGVSGWPDSTTDTADVSSGGAPRLFRMGDIQGQPYVVDDSGSVTGNVYYGRKW